MHDKLTELQMYGLGFTDILVGTIDNDVSQESVEKICQELEIAFNKNQSRIPVIIIVPKGISIKVEKIGKPLYDRSLEGYDYSPDYELIEPKPKLPKMSKQRR